VAGNRRALSPVIATIILSAVVLTIGGGLWAFAQGTSTIIAEDYVNGTLSLVDEITERFVVEWVFNSSNCDTLSVWVYNYGDVDLVVDVYIDVDDGNNGTTLGTEIIAGDYAEIDVSFAGDPLQKGDEVSIKVYSRRQNSAYYLYYV
jgi:flagellin-like protein